MMIQLFRIKNVSFIIIELFNQTASRWQKNLLYLLTSYIYIYIYFTFFSFKYILSNEKNSESLRNYFVKLQCII